MSLGLFSQRYGYAVHALAYIGKKSFGSLSTLPELAEWMRGVWPGASGTYLSSVIQRLARGGILQSHRGTAGGYSLGRPADEISLRDVAEQLEGVSLDRCSLSLGPQCAFQARCTIQQVLRDIEERFLESLEKVTLAQVAAQMNIKFPKGVAV